jgi:hypothetical protein
VKKTLAMLISSCAMIVSACSNGETPAVAVEARPNTTVSTPAADAIVRPSVPSTPGSPRRGSTSAQAHLETAAAEAPLAASLPEYREVILPAGTVLALRLETAAGSDSSLVEDVMHATLREDVRLDDRVVLPAGVGLSGRITDVERPGRVKGRARLAFRFTVLKSETDDYDVRTELIERVGAATKGSDAAKIGIGAGAGAALGAVLGGGSGAAKGAVIGGAAGTGTVLATRGSDVHVQVGDAVVTTLTADLAVRVRLTRPRS